MKVSEVKDLNTIVGKKVKTTRPFSGIRKNTIGVITKTYSIGPGHIGIDVKWKTTDGAEVVDGFGRDEQFDETKWLELV